MAKTRSRYGSGDVSAYFLGLRLKLFVALAMTAVGVAWFIGWFILAQRRGTGPQLISRGAPAATKRHPDEGSYPQRAAAM